MEGTEKASLKWYLGRDLNKEKDENSWEKEEIACAKAKAHSICSSKEVVGGHTMCELTATVKISDFTLKDMGNFQQVLGRGL